MSNNSVDFSAVDSIIKGSKTSPDRPTDKKNRRQRLTIDVPDWLQTELELAADNNNTTVSGIAGILIAHALIADIDFSRYRAPSRSPRYLYVMKIPSSLRHEIQHR